MPLLDKHPFHSELDLTSNRNRERQRLNPTDSVAAVVEPAVLLQMVEQIEAEEHNQMILQLAGEEDPTRWSAAIVHWIRTNSSSQLVRMTDLICELEMPWVEIWLGLLLGEFDLEQRGEFYSGEVTIRLQSEADEVVSRK